MSFDLNLGFIVKTEQLKDAVDQLNKVRDAIDGLNKAQAAKSTIDIKTAKAEELAAKAAKAQAEALEAQAKAEASVTKATEVKNAATAKSNKAQEEVTQAVKRTVSILERQRDILGFQVEGYSKGQASILATAKAAGQLSDELGNVLKTQRQLQGGDPFDKSISGLISMQNKLYEVNEAIRLYEKGISLTRDQTREFARDKERLILKMQQEKKTQDEINAAIDNHENQYVQVANTYNSIIKKETEHVDKLKQQIKSTNWLSNEEEKMLSVLRSLNNDTEMNSSLNEKAARSIANYERNLRQAGITGDAYNKKLETYKRQQQEITKVEQQRQVQYLQRGLQPQIGDVVVSLASGQNPLTVMLQQGDQIRGLIAQTGVQGEELRKAMAGALSGTVLSIKQTAGAMLSLLGGAIISTGDSLANVVSGPLTAFSKAMSVVQEDGSKANGFFGALSLAVKSLGVAMKALLPQLMIIGTVITGVIAVAQASIVAEEREMARALTLTGAQMGMNKEEAIKLAQAMNGISESKAKEVITEFAKAGVSMNVNLQELTKSAIDLEKYGGQSIETTAKQFADLQKDPVSALIKLGQQTGLVSMEIWKQVDSLEKVGKHTEAATLASQEYTKVISTLGAMSQNNLSPLELVIGNISSKFKEGWNSIKEWANSPAVINAITVSWKSFLSVLITIIGTLQSFRIVLGTVWNSLAKAMQFNFSGAVDELKTGLAEIKANGKLYAKEMQDIWSESYGKSNNAVPSSAEIKKAADAFALLDKTRKKSDKDAEKAAKERSSALDKYADILNKSLGLSASFNNDFEKIISLNLDSEDQLEAIQKLYEKQPFYTAMVKDMEARRKAEVKAIENAEQAMLSYFTMQLSITEAVAKENSELDFRLSLLGKTEEEQKKLRTEFERTAKIKEVEVELEKKLLDIQKNKYYNTLEGSIFGMAAEITAKEQAAEKIKLINKGVAITAAEDFRKEFDRISNGIADAIETALFEGGKQGRKKLRDLIVAELRKPITLSIQAVVKGIGNSLFGNSEFGKAIDSFVSGSNTLSSVFNAFTKGNTMADIWQGATAGKIGSTVYSAGSAIGSNAISSFGTGMGMSTSSAQSAAAIYQSAAAEASAMGNSAAAAQYSQTANSLTAGSTTGTVVSGLALVGAGQLVGRAVSGGYSAWGGESGSSAVNTGTAVGAAVGSIIPVIGTALGAAVGAVIGGAVNRAFGRKLTETGVMGQFSGTDFTGGQYKFEKGGWFKSDRTTQIADPALEQSLTSTYRTIVFETSNLVKYLGLSADKLTGFTYNMKLNLKGLSEDDAQKKLSEEFIKIQNQLIERMFSGIKDYQRKGEDNITTLKRMVDTLGNVNMAVSKIGNSLLALSLKGYDSAESLITLFGSVDNLTNSINSFYNEFFTEEEKLADNNKIVTEAFKQLNLTIPKTREEYRNLVKSQDLSTNTGRALFATLIDLSDEFAKMVPVLEDTKQNFKELMQTMIDTSTSGIDSQIKAMEDLGKKSRDTAEDYADAAKSIRDTINNIRNPSKSTADLGATLNASLAAAKGGDLSAMKAVGSQSEQFLSEYLKTAVSKTDYDRQASLIALQLDEVAKQADVQTLMYEYQAKTYDIAVATLESIKTNLESDNINQQLLRDQVLALYTLNSILDKGTKEQLTKLGLLNDISGINLEVNKDAVITNSLLTQITAGSSALLGAISKSLGESGAINMTNAKLIQGNTDIIAELSKIYYAIVKQAVEPSNPVIAPKDPNVKDPFGNAITNVMKSVTEGIKNILPVMKKSIYGDSSSSNADYFTGEYFASGGIHTGGLRVVGENGPELEATGPSRIYSASQTAAILSQSNYQSTQQMDILIQRIEQVEAAVRSTAVSNNKIAKILDRVTPDGQSIQTSTVV